LAPPSKSLSSMSLKSPNERLSEYERQMTTRIPKNRSRSNDGIRGLFCQYWEGSTPKRVDGLDGKIIPVDKIPSFKRAIISNN
jgi:hypothetical protein